MPAYDIGPRIGIEGEKEFKNSIKAIDSEIRALQNQLRTLSKEYDENDRSVEGVTKKQQALTKAIGATQDKIKLLTSQYDKQYQELKRLETALDSARQLHGENSEEALKAESALAKQATEVNNLESRLQTAKGQLATFSQELENTGNRATLAGDKIQSAGDKLEAVGGKLSSAGNTLTAAVTAPLLAAGGAAIVMTSDYSGLVWDASTGMWTQLSDDTAQAAQEMADLMNQYGISYSSEYAEGIASQYGLVYENGRWLVQKTADGVRDNTPTLLMEAEKSASDTVNQFDTTISGATVGPVKVATPDIASSVGVALDIAQSVANSRTIYYTVAARGAAGLTANSVSAYADGGLVDEPQLALIGEAGDEMVIPLERNRSRALDLWYQAGQELNAFAADSARAVGAIRREQIINNTTNRNMAINNAEGAIVIHTQATDGKQLYKELVREMQKDVKRKEAAYGKN